MSTTQNLGFSRLKGRENYAEWKVGARAYLTSKGLWKYVTTETTASSKAEDIASEQKALAELTLLLEAHLFSYVEDITAAKKAWEALESIFQDNGVLQKVFTLEQFVMLKLSDCDSLQDYVNKKVQLYSKTKKGFNIDDEVAGGILLCGLGETYKPLIMSVRDKLSPDYVKNLLLQSVDFEKDSENAMSAQNKKKFNKKMKSKKDVKCYDCGGPHFRNKCPSKNKEKSEKGECVLFSALGDLDTDKNSDKKECVNVVSHDVFNNLDREVENDEPASSENVLYSAYAINCKEDDTWFADSGATKHMTYMNLSLKNIKKPAVSDVTVANNEKLKIDHVGDLKCRIGEKSTKDITLSEVHYIPKLCVNLLSVSQMVKNGCTVIFDKTGVRICKYSEGEMEEIAQGEMVGNMFKLKIKPHEFAGAANAIGYEKTMLWHRRMAHMNFSTLKSLVNVKVKDDMQCVICAQGKQSRKPFNDIGTRANGLLELIHSDVCGPMSVQSHGHARYYVSFIDDYSRKCFIFLLKSKGEVFAKFILFKESVERETEKRIKRLRSDNGTEYENKNFHDYFAKYGIKHEKTAPYSPQHNGLAERMNRSIIEKARCMLLDSKLAKQFWAEAVCAAVDIINAIPNASTKVAPNVLWHGRQRDLKIFRVFGCRAMVWQPDQKRKKLDAKSYPCVYLRYADDAKAYRLYDMQSRKIVISRDVIFLENENMNDSSDASDSNNYVERITVVDENDTVDIFPLQDDTETIVAGENDVNAPTVEQVTPPAVPSTLNESAPVLQNVNENAVDTEQPRIEATVAENESIISIEDSDRSAYDSLNDTMDDGARDSSMDDPTFRTRARIDENARRMPTRSMDTDVDILNLHVAFAFVVGEPTGYKEALKSENCDKWKTAMKEEYDALVKNNTWTLVERPTDQKIVDNKWVYKVKAENKNVRYKARLVARGFTQEYGVNYFETFSPVVRFTSIRLILALAAQRKMSIRQFDVKTAFLNGILKERVFMEQPIGFQDGTNRVCQLNKSLYGLKQASRCWNEKFTSFIKLFGFTQSSSDSCVFISRKNGTLTILAIHVDDGLIVGENLSDIETVIKYLGKQFEIKEMDVDCFLGIEILQRKDGSIFIHQSTYANKVLCRFDMENCHGVTTPVDPNQTMYNYEESDTSTYPYRELIGSLMYLAVGTRPDIAYAVGIASRFLEKPSVVHERAAKRILKYLKRTINFGISYLGSKTNELQCYSDADYAGCITTRRSTSGYAFIFGSGVISWGSERQQSVSLSTAESEYMAASQCVKELVWLRKLFYEFLVGKISFENGDEFIFDKKILKIILFMDNNSAIRLIKNPEYHKRTKHIDVRYHFIREKYERDYFVTEYIQTKEMIADVFTKALSAQQFNVLIKKLGVTPT